MSDNPYLKRAAQRNIGDAGRASEKRVAQSLAARLKPASGAMRGAKGDSQINGETNYLIESKSTQGDSLKLDLGWLTKITAEALATNCKPLITISFVGVDGKLRGIKEDWVAMPRSTFEELKERKEK